MVIGETRKRVRIGIENHALARGEHQAYEGKLKDISAAGASIVFSVPGRRGKPLFKPGDSVEITIDNLSNLSGWVIRCDHQTAAIEFTHDNEGEEQLIAEIMDSM